MQSSSSCGGGALCDLLATGSMQKYLSSDETTLWKSKAVKTTKFALEAVTQVWNTPMNWGQQSSLGLQRGGDMIANQYVMLDIPGLDVKVMQGVSGGTQFPHEGMESGASGLDKEVFELSPVDQGPIKTNLARYANGNNANAEGIVCDMTNYSVWGPWRVVNSPQAYWTSEAKSGTADAETTFDMLLRARVANLQQAASRPSQTIYGSCGGEGPQNPGKLDVNPASPNYGAFDEDEEGPWAHWHNAIGMHAIRDASISIGGSIIDSVWSDWLYCYEEVACKPGRKLEEMVGKAYSKSELICDSRSARRLYVPLPWWFTQETFNALPLSSLQFHGIALSVTFTDIENCIVTSKPPPGTSIMVMNSKTKQPIGIQDLKGALLTTYVYLDTKERTLFSQSSFDQMIQQTQRSVISSNAQFVRTPITFNHPIVFLMWTIRREAAERENDYFNYSGINGEDPLADVSLSLNNQVRFGGLPGSYYRLVQPYQHFKKIPQNHIYCYSFAVDALSANSCGYCNFSRIDNVELNMTLQQHLGSEVVTIAIWARSWNVLRFVEGLAGLAFTS